MDDDRRRESGATAGRARRAAERRCDPVDPLPRGCTIKFRRYYIIVRNKWTGLTRVSDGAIAFWREYYKLTQADPNLMTGVMLAYLEHGMGDLAPSTRKKYEQAIIFKLIPYCGHMAPNQLTPTHVAVYLETRKEDGAPVSSNREFAVLSSVCNFGMRKGWMASNPCYSVSRNTERPSRRYVEHTELVTALDRAKPALYALNATAYNTGARQTDIVAWTAENLTEHGIEYIESKTGKPRLIEWTPTLRILIQSAIDHREAVAARHDKRKRRQRAAEVRAQPFIFLTTRGLPWSEWGLQSAMRRFKPGYTLRQLRPKAETDKPGILGHTGQMQRRYTRRQTVRPVK